VDGADILFIYLLLKLGQGKEEDRNAELSTIRSVML
jgi:hypothetical protein